MENKTTDLNYSYLRKTIIDKHILRFNYEYDLREKIVDIDLADIILYTNQRDTDLQQILKKYDLNEEIDTSLLLKIVNEYRIHLLNQEV